MRLVERRDLPVRTQSRIPPMNFSSDHISRRKLRNSWLSAMQRAFRDGSIPTRRHAWERVYRALADLMGPDLRLFPSHATIASRSCTSPRTVIQAIQAAAAIGLIRVTPRYVYDANLGKRVRTSNAYQLVVAPVARAAAAVAEVARRARDVTMRQAARTVRAVRDLTAQFAEDTGVDIFRGENNPLTGHSDPVDASQMTRDDLIAWCNRPPRPTV